jgi:hypothetical protein
MRLRARRAAHLLVSSAAVLATVTACVPPSPHPHVTMVGDSTLAAMVWYDQAGVTRSQDVVRAAYDLTLDAESCRRLVAPSCRGRFGYVPNTTMDVLRANRGRLGEAVVIMGGYDDISIGSAVPEILAETEAQGVEHVVWLTYPLNVPYILPSGFPARSLYASHNLVLYLNSVTHPTLHLADWNSYSAGHPDWFGRDGIHLSPAGTMALASYLKAQLDLQVVVPPPPPPPPPPPAPPPPPPPPPETTAPPTTVVDTSTTVVDTTTTTSTTSTAPTTTAAGP